MSMSCGSIGLLRLFLSRCSCVVLLWNMKKRGWCPESGCRNQSDTLGIGSSGSKKGMSRCLISGIGIVDEVHIQARILTCYYIY
ncbi:hypothetical protein Tco_1171417, partial [Tanacetum coccineum]